MPDAPDDEEPRASALDAGRRGSRLARLCWLALLAPTLFLGPTIVSGARLLPHLPVILQPLAGEHPAAAAEAQSRVRYGPADRVFPALSDQIVARAELKSLDLPTWEPNLGLGVPLFASSIAGLGYPPNWLACVLPPDVAAGPLAWLSLALAGLGMGLFLRRLGLSGWAVAAGIVGVQAGGFGLANVVYFMKVDAIVWLPWCLWAVEGLARGMRRSGLALALFVGLSFLAGFPPIAVFGLCATCIYAGLRFSALGGRLLGLGAEHAVDSAGAAFVRLGARALGAVALGLGIAAWQLLPTIEASGQSLRQAKSAAEIAGEALPVATLAGVVVPDLVAAPDEAPSGASGTPMAWWLTPVAEREKAANANVLEWNTYAGVALVLLAVAALAGAPRRARVPALGLAACYAFAQDWLGAGALLYRLPGLGAGSPNRVLAVAWVLWPWLAAVGVEALVGGARGTFPRRARAALVAAAVAFALGAGALALALDPAADAPRMQQALLERYAALPEPPTPAVVESYVPRAAAERAIARVGSSLERAALVGLVAGAGGLVLLVLAPRRRFGVALGGALALAAVAGDGAWTAARHLPAQRPGALALFPPSEAIEAVRAAAGDGRVVRLVPEAAGGDAEALRGGVEALARPNLLQVYRIADLTPWTVFTPHGLVELVGESAHGARDGLDPDARWRSGIAGLTRVAQLDAPLLDLLRVTCVLTEAPVEHPSLALAFERPGFLVYRRRGALPLARIVAEAVATPSDAVARGLLVSGAFDARRQALLAPGLTPEPPAPGAEDAAIERVSRPSKNRLDLVVRGSQGGLLVMHEQWFPGWKATINGIDADIVRVDHVYRGLWLPAGDLLIRTKYEPWSLRLGFALMALCLSAAVGLGVRRGF
jgi:hypothetical protein